MILYAIVDKEKGEIAYDEKGQLAIYEDKKMLKQDIWLSDRYEEFEFEGNDVEDDVEEEY